MRDFQVWLGTALSAFSSSSTAVVPTAATVEVQDSTSKSLVTFEDVFSGNFRVNRTMLQWTSQGEDGMYVDADSEGSLNLANIVTGNSKVLVNVSDLPKKVHGYYEYLIQPSGEHILFQVNRTKQYRYSDFSDYYVFNVQDKTIFPLAEDQHGDIQYATFSPQTDTIAYVRGNDIYIWHDGNTTRITDDGGPDVFNGVPDWVYEEEIFVDKFALWFSPDGCKLAFLRFNETGVETYSIPYYMGYPGTIKAELYPTFLDLRYPKAGSTNPTVSFNVVSIDDLGEEPEEIQYEAFDRNDTVIGEVAWVTDNSSHVIFRVFNRVQDREKIVLVDTAKNSASVVRERADESGWIDNKAAIRYIPGSSSYVDMSDESGWNHLYLYEVRSSTPTPITSGNWEVTALLNINARNKTIYYQSTERDSTERHIYSISLDGANKQALVDDSQPGYWTASFSAGGGYYIQSYNGPDLPHQKLYAAGDAFKSIKTIHNNTALAAKLSSYALPKVSWTAIEHPDGYSLNVMERLPPNFDSSKQYPVIFDPYGGPGSQSTGKTFRQVDFKAYLASDPELEYVVLTVDNRGTGLKGRKFRTVVTGQLGVFEAQDQVYVAQQYAKKPYVDASHVSMMGWSFGGFLTAKVLELGSDVFSFGIITAPVSDFRFYDSIYTERYMKLPSTNPSGYATSAVHNVTGFKDVRGGFLMQHGTGDDNVHFQNSAALVDTLTSGGVGPGNMHVHYFTDSDHGINFHGASQFVYKQMAQYLYKERMRKDEKLVHQFDRRGVVDSILRA
ncbi:dipeptidyl peptidase IV N-terminal region-domain-containing protein [Calycina marina]|uniref:dipeptidyl-peptidase IV n=1 Tax=Calycina marina TaxID=1763456 RepID=A0A9P7ZAT2_9HELO|nr:dipeptidyl peptidase IV N-terminal region-domain-containing protein [Calycina marina]